MNIHTPFETKICIENLSNRKRIWIDLYIHETYDDVLEEIGVQWPNSCDWEVVDLEGFDHLSSMHQNNIRQLCSIGAAIRAMGDPQVVAAYLAGDCCPPWDKLTELIQSRYVGHFESTGKAYQEYLENYNPEYRSTISAIGIDILDSIDWDHAALSHFVNVQDEIILTDVNGIFVFDK